MARHIAANFVNLLIVMLIAAGGLFYWAKAEFSNAGPLENAIFIEVPRGGTVSRLANELESQGERHDKNTDNKDNKDGRAIPRIFIGKIRTAGFAIAGEGKEPFKKKSLSTVRASTL